MPDKIVTTDFLDRLDTALKQQSGIVEEVHKLRRSQRGLKFVIGILAVLGLGLGVLTGVTIDNIRDQRSTAEITRIDTCQGRNSSQRSLREAQLQASIDTIDALLAGIDATSGPTPERTALAETVKNQLRTEAAERERNPTVPDQDCDRDGTPGGVDSDDYVQIPAGKTPEPSPLDPPPSN